jgi:hypothetical protein
MLLSQIQANGSRAVLARLWQDPRHFEEVCDHIETGAPGWLRVASELRASSDAGQSTSLNYSVARALPRAPVAVLSLIGRGFTVEDVCTSPFIEPDPGVAERYQKRALKALRRVRELHLQSTRDACIVRVGAKLQLLR